MEQKIIPLIVLVSCLSLMLLSVDMIVKPAYATGFTVRNIASIARCITIDPVDNYIAVVMDTAPAVRVFLVNETTNAITSVYNKTSTQLGVTGSCVNAYYSDGNFYFAHTTSGNPTSSYVSKMVATSGVISTNQLGGTSCSMRGTFDANGNPNNFGSMVVSSGNVYAFGFPQSGNCSYNGGASTTTTQLVLSTFDADTMALTNTENTLTTNACNTAFVTDAGVNCKDANGAILWKNVTSGTWTTRSVTATWIGVTVDSTGQYAYLADPTNSNVRKWDSHNPATATTIQFGSTSGARMIALLSSGNFLLSSQTASITQYSSSGTAISTLTSANTNNVFTQSAWSSGRLLLATYSVQTGGSANLNINLLSLNPNGGSPCLDSSCEEPTPTPPDTGGTDCDLPANENLLICRLGGNGEISSAGAFVIGNISQGTGILGMGCSMGIVDCTTDQNPQTNGLGYLIFIASIFVVIGMFYRSLGANATFHMPIYIWAVIILALSAFFTITHIIDPTMLILTVVALVALAVPRVGGYIQKGFGGDSGSTE